MRTKERLSTLEAARRVGLAASTLRALDRRGLYKARRDWNGHRVYTAGDVTRLRRLAGLDPEESGR